VAEVFALGVVVLVAVYFLGLGVLSLVRPERVKAFLGGFAASAWSHFTEMAVRLVVGGALLVSWQRLAFPQVFWFAGWILVGTTAVLLCVPWRLHRRFASWSVARATRNMTLFAVGPLVFGVFLLYALVG
jgi:hypothetical protein